MTTEPTDEMAASLERDGFSEEEITAMRIRRESDARRAFLAVLLDRVDRDALLPAEKTLLRALVGAEQEAADARPTPVVAHRVKLTVHNQETTAALRPLLADLDTLRERAEQAEAEAEALRRAQPGNGRLYDRAVQEKRRADRAVAALTRVRAVLSYADQVVATTGPGPAAAVRAVADRLRTALGDDQPAKHGGLCHDTDPTTLKECARPADHNGNHADANTTWPQRTCRAQAHPLGRTALHCNLPAGHDGDHSAHGLPHPFTWPESVAVYPTDDNPEQPNPPAE